MSQSLMHRLRLKAPENTRSYSVLIHDTSGGYQRFVVSMRDGHAAGAWYLRLINFDDDNGWVSRGDLIRRARASRWRRLNPTDQARLGVVEEKGTQLHLIRCRYPRWVLLVTLDDIEGGKKDSIQRIRAANQRIDINLLANLATAVSRHRSRRRRARSKVR